MALVELRGLTKRYGSLPVVDRLDLTIGHGELVCLLGPSGCGKTTTLRLLAGFLTPDGGEIHVGGRRLSAPGSALPPEQRSMSMIFQSYALWPHMTIAENVAYGLTVRGAAKEETARRVEKILAVTRMAPFAARYPTELSGGQQQRVALARALVVQPETLLLDEPLSNLDANLREEMRFEVRRLHDEYKYTTLYVTHDQVEAMTAADRIVVMNGGRVEQAGTPEDIYERPESEFVANFIGGTNILHGTHRGDGVVECAGAMLRCGQGTPAADGKTAVSIRLHDVELRAGAPAAGTLNMARGRIVRQVYLGATRDYLVDLAAGDSIRAVVPRAFDHPAGSVVAVHFPPAACRALAR
ncbi:MAG TPA: ABC transporter ATP-binding protein [Stellaceae bacterium]|nr:ABC transporter ATP-binding protein [Stellaceae bacterium]